MKIVKPFALVFVLFAAGCSGASTPEAPVAAPPSAASSPAPSAAPAVRVGAAGSACEMPLSFDLATDWKPSAVDLASFGELAALGKVGDFGVICEIDAKPAGHIGYLRVYVADGLSGAPRDHLAAFLKAGVRGQEISGTTYRDLKLGAQQGAEVTWQSYDKSLDHRGKYSAFALNTTAGAVIVQLSPFGEDEYEDMLPAFRLAASSVTV
ncbi:lipoprotein [Actinoplanes couchii]|uniref:Lipoprotein n=1 Tax=Actinoplanes couchii TaxID=403638 RepID=A0ABQ3XPN5_9ACTN|nr:lipoprotein [Actinoplanes couchii]MDR6319135.1 hypothetical protein [Actinoplanes couchii]GID60476.1 hypothetical protein Aco03nite_088800 [Actinoplanes couchii]